MEFFRQSLSFLSDMLWGYPMIILLIGTHLFLSFRLRFPQRRILTAIKLSVTDDKEGNGDVSQLGALSTALAATIGTGNIIGIGTAVALGGPGAVLWCWLTGVFGIATKYGESLLAVKYRRMSEKGYMVGGPMYALEYGLNAKWAGVLFALFTAVAAFGIGSTVQANAISTLTTEEFGISPWITACIITLLVALVVVGGIQSIAKVCTALVPSMAMLYVLGCIIILCFNYEYILPSVELIVSAAFTTKSAVGGVAGGGIMLAARYGIARGLFSNESGLGSAPLVAASAKTKNPVRQALVSSSGTFWDTVVVCAVTGIVVVSSILSYTDAQILSAEDLDKVFYANIQAIMPNMDGGTLTKIAFSKIPFIGSTILVFGLYTFAFSTILGWCIYAQRAVEYLGGYKIVKAYTYVFLAVVFIGAIMELDMVWTLADIFNALMAIPNLFALILLSNVIAKETDKYLWNNNLDKDWE